jgi:sialate O-acetylesterase
MRHLLPILLSLTLPALADISLPAIFNHHMVLQRDKPVALWGTAAPGESVTAALSSFPTSVSTTADATGQWRLTLPPMPASSTPATLTFRGATTIGHTTTIELTNILIGEVWLCSGQSNMQMGLAKSQNGEQAVASAHHPAIRLFNVRNRIAEGDIQGNWAPATPASTEKFSAVGYYFGRQLHADLDVPIGLIGVSWGATGIEAWTPASALGQEPATRIAAREKAKAKYEADLAAGLSPKIPQSLRPENGWGACYTALVRPISGLTVRGVIWYQGEGNLGSGPRYADMLTRLIHAWRADFGQDLPFGIVQLPNNQPPSPTPAESNWATIREAQRLAATQTTNTGLITTIDIGDPADGHPKNKKDVGQRLAFWALTELYNLPRPYHGPRLLSATQSAEHVTLTFSHTGQSLTTKDTQPPAGFAIQTADNIWHWAPATLVPPSQIILPGRSIQKIRYAYADNPAQANLTDATNLPAPPFEVIPR